MRIQSVAIFLVVVVAPILGRAAFAAEEESGGLPQLRQSDTFASQVFWLAVFFALLYVLLNRLFLPRLHNAISERQARIQGDLTHAESMHREGKLLQESLEADLARARGEAGAKVRGMQEVAEKKAGEEQARLTQDLEAELQRSEAQLGEERRACEARLLEDAAPFVVAVALRLGGHTMRAGDARRILEGLER